MTLRYIIRSSHVSEDLIVIFELIPRARFMGAQKFHQVKRGRKTSYIHISPTQDNHGSISDSRDRYVIS